MALIRPGDLPAAVSVTGTDAFIVDNGVTVEKSTPLQIIDAARPLASQAEAEAGSENSKIMTALRVQQAITAMAPGGGTVSSVNASGGTTGFTFTGGPITGTGVLTLEVSSGATARAALGLVIGTDVQAYDADLTTWAGKTAPSGTVVGTTDTQTLSAKTLTAPTITGFTETVSAPAAGAAFSPSLTAATAFYYQTNANTTITLPAPATGKSFTICVRYGGTHTLTWAGGARKWPGGITPTATSTSGKEDEFAFRCYDGSNWIASMTGANF